MMGKMTGSAGIGNWEQARNSYTHTRNGVSFYNITGRDMLACICCFVVTVISLVFLFCRGQKLNLLIMRDSPATRIVSL